MGSEGNYGEIIEIDVEISLRISQVGILLRKIGVSDKLENLRKIAEKLEKAETGSKSRKFAEFL